LHKHSIEDEDGTFGDRLILI